MATRWPSNTKSGFPYISCALILHPDRPTLANLARSLRSVDLFLLPRLADMICERFCFEKTSAIGLTYREDLTSCS